MTNTVPARQVPRPSADRDARREDRQRELREKRLQTLNMRKVLEQRDQARIDAAIKRIKDDFKQIQITRNEMVHNLAANMPLDYKLISNETAEINKRADRLKTFLMPPDAELKDKDSKDHVEFNNNEIKGALVQLCNLIAGFIAIYNLGLASVVERKYEEAATVLEHAARLRPQSPDGFLFLGNAYHGLGQFDKAVEAFNKCMTLNPDLDKTSIFAAEVHFLLGRSLVQTGRPEEAEKHLMAARELKAKALTTDRDKLDAYMKAEEYKSAQSLNRKISIALYRNKGKAVYR